MDRFIFIAHKTPFNPVCDACDAIVCGTWQVEYVISGDSESTLFHDLLNINQTDLQLAQSSRRFGLQRGHV